MAKFTQYLLEQITPQGKPKILKEYPAILNELLPEYKINNPKRIALFLANIMTETGGLRTIEENLYYSAPRLMKVWPRRFPTIRSAEPYARNPEALANNVYNRFGNRGHKGYGWKYRGRGPMMTTFIDGYASVQKVTGLTVVKDPDMLLELKTGLIAACVFWDKNELNKLADQGQITKVRKIINGGTHGLTSVKVYYKNILPKVKDLDLQNKTGKIVVTSTSGAIAAGTLISNIWVAVALGVSVTAAIIALFAYRSYLNNKQVADALVEVGPIELDDQEELMGAELSEFSSKRHEYIESLTE